MGVRLALGAGPRDVARLVLRQGLLLGGGCSASAACWQVAPLLFDTSPREPVVLAGVVATLLVVPAAGPLPAWRASRTPPSAVLRAE